jgi:hypothetical protein
MVRNCRPPETGQLLLPRARLIGMSGRQPGRINNRILREVKYYFPQTAVFLFRGSFAAVNLKSVAANSGLISE